MGGELYLPFPLLLACPSKMPTNNPSNKFDPSYHANSVRRVQSIAKQMSPPAATSFTAEVVPQAPEDPLFGLMRAFKADESPDKVDLVSRTTHPITRSCARGSGPLLTFPRALERTATTTQSPGFYQWSRRYVLLSVVTSSSSSTSLSTSELLPRRNGLNPPRLHLFRWPW